MQKQNRAFALRDKAVRNWRITRIFWERRLTILPGTPCCRSASERFHNSLSRQHFQSSSAGTRGQRSARDEQRCRRPASLGPGHSARDQPHRIPACRGTGYSSWADAGRREDFRCFLAEPSAHAGRPERAGEAYRYGAEVSLTPVELRSLGDAYFNAGRASEEADQYNALLRSQTISEQERASIQVAVAACELKLKHLTPAQVQGLPDTADENGARRLDLLMELARDRGDTRGSAADYFGHLEQRRPTSPMALSRHCFRAEICTCSSATIPRRLNTTNTWPFISLASKNAPAVHWRGRLAPYRQGLYLLRPRKPVRRADQGFILRRRRRCQALYWRGQACMRPLDHDPVAGCGQLSRHCSRLSALLLRSMMARMPGSRLLA